MAFRGKTAPVEISAVPASPGARLVNLAIRLDLDNGGNILILHP